MASLSREPDKPYKRCRDCGGSMPSWRRRHVARTCPSYSEIWAGDVRVKIFAALRAYAESVPGGVKTRQVRMLTVTAPGEEAGLPWDASVCSHRGPHRHSGPQGCRVAPAVAGAWNRQAPVWWRSLHHEASQATLRRTGGRPSLLVRPWELQQRGMLHVHPVLGCSTVAERRTARVYAEELKARSLRHGFGFVDDRARALDPVAAAAYLSSYFVAGKKGKMTLREAVSSRAMPRSIVYVRPELSQRSGITMRSLRLRRYAWRVWRHELEPRGLGSEVAVLDVWAGLVEGKTLAQTVSGCL